MTKPAGRLGRIAKLGALVAHEDQLDRVITVCLGALDDLFGCRYSMVLAFDEPAARLYTIASHGYAPAGIGSEIGVGLGQGFLGLAAAEMHTVRIGALRRIVDYGRAAYREHSAGTEGDASEVRLPGLPDVQSQIAAPIVASGRLLGVLAVESPVPTAFDSDDEAVLSVAAQLLAGAIEREHLTGAPDEAGAATASPATADQRPAHEPVAVVRYYPADASTFFDGHYLVKGVPGRILWKLLNEWQADGRVDFTNREVRLDPALELPSFKDNFETRLILLKRRLDERSAPVRIETTGRGRFRLHVTGGIRLDAVAGAE
jgi:adenylate cyclase